MTCAVFLGPRNRDTALTTSARLDSHTGIVRTRPFSHLLHSSSQLLTSDVGHTMSAREAVGAPSRVMPWRRSVQRSVIPWRVFPRPMSSARMHPSPAKSRRPMTHSNMNLTPSRWCGRRNRTSALSTATGGRRSLSESSAASSHRTRGSTPGGKGSSEAASREGSGPGAAGVGRAKGFGAPLPHGTKRRRVARRRWSSADGPAGRSEAPLNGARNGAARTAATSWHRRPATADARDVVSEPLSIARTLRALSSACESTTGRSSSSSDPASAAAASAAKSASESDPDAASESSELSAANEGSESDMTNGGDASPVGPEARASARPNKSRHPPPARIPRALGSPAARRARDATDRLRTRQGPGGTKSVERRRNAARRSERRAAVCAEGRGARRREGVPGVTSPFADSKNWRQA